jgi:hypothetical protein
MLAPDEVTMPLVLPPQYDYSPFMPVIWHVLRFDERFPQVDVGGKRPLPQHAIACRHVSKA